MESLLMQWEYDYDKEGTWFDHEEGAERFALAEAAAYPLPHLRGKCVTVVSLERDGDTVTATLYVDHRTVTVKSDGESVSAHASDDYSVAGDSVHQTLSLVFSIERDPTPAP